MIPSFGPVTRYLPRGEHPATWKEVEEALGFSVRRRALLVGLLAACRELRRVGATSILLNGSFATRKWMPEDYDACYDLDEIDTDIIDPVLIDTSNGRLAMKNKYLGEFFPSTAIADRRTREPYRSYFQHDENGPLKGLIVLDLGTLP